MIVASKTKLFSLEQRAADLKQSISTLKWQITEMANFYSPDQVRAWRKRKRSLTIQLNYVKRDIKTLTEKINGSTRPRIPARTH